MPLDPVASKSLNAAQTRQIRALCRVGYRHYDANELQQALRYFYRAWLVLPKPQQRWEQAGWVLTAIGDTYYRLADYRNAREALLSALHCPNIQGNPFPHLRLAQSLRELGHADEAATHFNIAAQAQGSVDPFGRP